MIPLIFFMKKTKAQHALLAAHWALQPGGAAKLKGNAHERER
jgi:hypothetical protein